MTNTDKWILRIAIYGLFGTYSLYAGYKMGMFLSKIF